MRIVIMGNSGSGKSTLAKRLAVAHQLAHLDLDTLAWLSSTPPARAPRQDSLAKLASFTAAHDRWVIEGCYADLVDHAVAAATELVFLNPGVEVCIAHSRARPWEPHKYASQQAQDDNLPMLIDWLRTYETRDDEFSLRAHRALFESFAGAKRELT